MFALLSFWVSFFLSLSQSKQRQLLCKKTLSDWCLDVSGLCVQGAVIPILQILLISKGYAWIFPKAKGCLDWQFSLSFIACFVGVDYLYYWAHRALHTSKLFPIHIVHHTITQMDMVSISRNTLWSSLFIPYVWMHSLMIYLLLEPRGYLWGVTLTYLLDIWRHSSFNLSTKSRLYCLLNSWLIMSQDHANHHRYGASGNFGANLKCWDRLHKTMIKSTVESQPLGIPVKMNLGQKLFFPFAKSHLSS